MGQKKLGEALIVITSIRTVLTNQKRIYIAITLNTLESGADWLFKLVLAN